MTSGASSCSSSWSRSGSTRFDAAGAVALAPELERRAAGAGADRGARARCVAGIAHLLAGERDEAIRCFRAPPPHPDQATMAAFDYMSLEWYDELRSSLSDTLADGSPTGNLHRIIWNRSCAAHLELRQGRLAAAEAAAAEALRLGELLDEPKAPIACAALAGIHAWRGDIDACTANARRAAASARSAHDRFPEGLAHGALALLALGRRRPADAVAELEPLAAVWAASTVRDPAATPFIPDLDRGLRARGERPTRLVTCSTGSRRSPARPATSGCRQRAPAARGCSPPPTNSTSRSPARSSLLEPSSYTLELARVHLALGERLGGPGRAAQRPPPGGARGVRSGRGDPVAGAGRAPSCARPALTSRPDTTAAARSHPAGAGHRNARRRGKVEQGGRRSGVPQPEDRRVPPREHVPQAEHPLARRARTPDPRERLGKHPRRPSTHVPILADRRKSSALRSREGGCSNGNSAQAAHPIARNHGRSAHRRRFAFWRFPFPGA